MKFSFGAYNPIEHSLKSCSSPSGIAAHMLGESIRKWIIFLRIDHDDRNSEVKYIDISDCKGSVYEIERICTNALNSYFLESV